MTTDHSCRRRLTAGLLTVGLFAWGVAGTSDVVRAQSQSFFISFADADGVPVTDLTREDVVVELDGELAESVFTMYLRATTSPLGHRARLASIGAGGGG